MGDLLKRSDWWIGKILKSIKSKGDKIRFVKVDVISKDKIITLKRPINKLFHIQLTNQKNKELNFANEKDITQVAAGGRQCCIIKNVHMI